MPVTVDGRHDNVAVGGARFADHAVLARARQSGGRLRPPGAGARRRTGEWCGRSTAASDGEQGRKSPKASTVVVRPRWGRSARPSNCEIGALRLEDESVQGHGWRRPPKHRARHRQGRPDCLRRAERDKTTHFPWRTGRPSWGVRVPCGPFSMEQGRGVISQKFARSLQWLPAHPARCIVAGKQSRRGRRR